MARIDRRTRNRRLGGLVAVVALIVLVLALLIRWGCGGSDDATSTGGDSSTNGGDVVVSVGETVARGDASVTVTAFAPVGIPTLPRSVASPGPQPVPGEGQTYHQAFVWFENNGEEPVRIEPLDFSLLAGNGRIPPDLTRSGPAARTLLRGASMELILTFIGPDEDSPNLEYRSSWSQGTIIFEGQQKPAGMAARREIWRSVRL